MRKEVVHVCCLVITSTYHLYQVHAKAVLKDVEGAVPDEAPMMIWDDEIELGWSADEREGLREMGGFEARHSKYTVALRTVASRRAIVSILWLLRAVALLTGASRRLSTIRWMYSHVTTAHYGLLRLTIYRLQRLTMGYYGLL